MAGTMTDYITEQPRVLRSILGDRKENTLRFTEEWKRGSPDRLYLVASGTSNNAAAMAVPFMEELLGTEVRVAPPTLLPRVYGNSPFALFVSQGGNSNNTISAIEQWKGIHSLALTGQKECRINEIHPHVSIGCGPETAGPKTKGYTATVMTLYLLALETALALGRISGEEYRSYIGVLETAVENMEGNIRRCETWLSENLESLKKIEKCFVVARTTAFPVAQEGALKILETMLVPAAAYEFEEYLHGPICALDDRMAGIYLLPESGDGAFNRMNRLVEFHRGISPLVFTAGSLGGDKRDCGLALSGRWYTEPFELILPCQIMGAKLPAVLGIEDNGSKVYKALDSALNIKFAGGI
ncbi:SIS domain-containing protein [Breznakiella homolactica]|uniref:SIS domain-containing protein n=1 Tax=Breznakiella homolactica TaxID=2798577 RepID=A0A7T7XLK8_9SPIR|nr:hypothetical protein [Breznakiella homolactica]QQO08483.1 hypothetical protein JFL75_16320 [Breznakiella homolactica]